MQVTEGKLIAVLETELRRTFAEDDVIYKVDRHREIPYRILLAGMDMDASAEHLRRKRSAEGRW